MIDHIVVDVEIQRTIEELPNGWRDTDKMGVACACVWEYQRQRMRVYGPEDLDALQARILNADRITGFNTWAFDFPVIWGLPSTERVQELAERSNDLLARIWAALENANRAREEGWNLDTVAGLTIGARKIGNGADAPRWFQAGQWARVANYCADDVAVERDLSDFVDRYGYVIGGLEPRMLYLP